MKKVSLLLDEQQLTIIIQALAEARYRVAAPLMEVISAQLVEQREKCESIKDTKQ